LAAISHVTQGEGGAAFTLGLVYFRPSACLKVWDSLNFWGALGRLTFAPTGP